MTRARDVADTQDNVGGSVPPSVAGKNKIINGDFGIWQRGTSTTTSGVYLADRFLTEINGNGTYTVSQQTMTPGTAPVTGYESAFNHRWKCDTLGTSTVGNIRNYIEDVRTLAGQTVTFSFWAKADSARTIEGLYAQNFGSGGSSLVEGTFGNFNITTSWARYSATITLPSISSKTIGTSSYLQVRLKLTSLAAGYTLDTWGWQLEAGNVATPFTTATGTIQGELAACQRYYVALANFASFSYSSGNGSSIMSTLPFPVTMRANPTVTVTSNGTNSGVSSVSIQSTSTTSAVLQVVASTSGHIGIYGSTAANAAIEL